jgi:hypothetical protein
MSYLQSTFQQMPPDNMAILLNGMSYLQSTFQQMPPVNMAILLNGVSYLQSTFQQMSPVTIAMIEDVKSSGIVCIRYVKCSGH